MKAYTFAGRRLRQDDRRRRCPPTWPTRPTAARDALIEMVAEADESLMEKFFEAGTLTQDELVTGLADGDARGEDLPAACARRGCRTSASQPLLDAMLALPALAGRPPVHGARRGGETRHAPGRREGAVRGVRLEDGGRSVRRAASRCSASTRAR